MRAGWRPRPRARGRRPRPRRRRSCSAAKCAAGRSAASRPARGDGTGAAAMAAPKTGAAARASGSGAGSSTAARPTGRRAPRAHRPPARPAVGGVQAQPLQLVAGEAETDGAGHGLLGLPAAAALGTRRRARRTPRGTPRGRGTTAAPAASSAIAEDGGDAGGAQAVHVVQQQRRAAAQVESTRAPPRSARLVSLAGRRRDAARVGARDAGVERAAVGQGLQIGGAFVEDGAAEDDRERLRGRGHRRRLVAEQPAGEAVDGLAERARSSGRRRHALRGGAPAAARPGVTRRRGHQPGAVWWIPWISSSALPIGTFAGR